ncbi:hypothetical protein ANANG_G00042800, partial [Anguilla anguilla]
MAAMAPALTDARRPKLTTSASNWPPVLHPLPGSGENNSNASNILISSNARRQAQGPGVAAAAAARRR